MPRWLEKCSPYPVPATLDRLTALLVEQGCAVMARIDHSANAAKIGLDLRPTQLLLFGKPSLGTQLMQAEQTVAIDLPSWQDASGQVRLGYHDLRTIAAEHGGLGKAGAAVEELSRIIDSATDAAVTLSPP